MTREWLIECHNQQPPIHWPMIAQHKMKKKSIEKTIVVVRDSQGPLSIYNRID